VQMVPSAGVSGSVPLAAATPAVLRAGVEIAPATIVGGLRRAAAFGEHRIPGVAKTEDNGAREVDGRLMPVVRRLPGVRRLLGIHFFFRRLRTKSGRLVTAPRAERTPLTTE